MIDDTVTLGNILGTLGVIASVGGFFWKVKQDNKAEGIVRTNELKDEFKVMQTGLSERLTKAETKIADFMPRAEIEAKIEHEKVNRTAADLQLQRITDSLALDVRAIMIGQTKIEQQQHDTSSSVSDIKESIKELSRDLSGRFDKVSREISSLTLGHRVRGEIDHN